VKPANIGAILPAELGRLDEARAAVAENLAKFPDTSIEGWMGTPDRTDWERELFTKSMRKAGFPVCATENELKPFPNLIRLPECVQEDREVSLGATFHLRLRLSGKRAIFACSKGELTAPNGAWPSLYVFAQPSWRWFKMPFDGLRRAGLSAK
jgi:hypothetical protein